MKVNLDNLMRGDLVRVRGTVDYPNIDRYGIPYEEIVPVEEIRFDTIIANGGNEYQLKDVEDIRLTFDIAHQNGFVALNPMKYIYDIKDADNKVICYMWLAEIPHSNIDAFRLTVQHVNEDGSTMHVKVSTVSELQHALRVCHLGDFAKQIKIK